MTEREFMQQIIDIARLLGWRVFHSFDSRRSEPGFPDLVLVRDRLVFLELKTAAGRVTPEQAAWINAINAAGGTALVVRPSDMDEIEYALKRRIGSTNVAAGEASIGSHISILSCRQEDSL